MIRYWLCALALALGACGPRVKTSGVRTAAGSAVNTGPVTVRASDIPNGAKEVGVAQAHGTGTIEDLIPAFAKHVGKLGGNFGKVDEIKTRFEMSTQTRTESYNCGTPQAPRTCTRTTTQNVEVATTTVIGRAFFVEGAIR